MLCTLCNGHLWRVCILTKQISHYVSSYLSLHFFLKMWVKLRTREGSKLGREEREDKQPGRRWEKFAALSLARKKVQTRCFCYAKKRAEGKGVTKKRKEEGAKWRGGIRVQECVCTSFCIPENFYQFSYSTFIIIIFNYCIVKSQGVLSSFKEFHGEEFNDQLTWNAIHITSCFFCAKERM